MKVSIVLVPFALIDAQKVMKVQNPCEYLQHLRRENHHGRRLSVAIVTDDDDDDDEANEVKKKSDNPFNRAHKHVSKMIVNDEKKIKAHTRKVESLLKKKGKSESSSSGLKSSSN